MPEARGSSKMTVAWDQGPGSLTEVSSPAVRHGRRGGFSCVVSSQEETNETQLKSVV